MEEEKEDRILDEAASLAGAWLAKFGLELTETFNEHGNNVGMEISAAPGTKDGTVGLVMNNAGHFNGTRSCFGWDWASSSKDRRAAWMYVLCVLFQEEERAVGNVVHEVRVDTPDFGAKGYRRIDRKTYKVPKFRFGSVEEFVLKAAASPDFAEAGRGG